MRVMIAIVMCWLAASPAGAQTGPPGAPGDETAVRDIVQRYVDARDKRDARLLEALFTADADQLTTAGEWRQGRDSVVRGGLASSQANPGSRQITIEVVRFLAAGVAIADGRYEIAGADGAAPRKMRTTFVVTRTATGWRIAAIRNMAPTDPVR